MGTTVQSGDLRESKSLKTSQREEKEERLVMGKDAAGDFDDSDLADMGCELAMVGDQLCSIPYDLYNLPDLRGLLSLETWNSCLTEEERFHLAAYLPDMDNETFVLTINELFSGDNLFFGSPLDSPFHRLQGGFYSPQVTHIREGLQLLQKRGHHHSLRLYHENMTQKFVDMKKTWSSCLSSTTIEERVRIWNNRKEQKPVLLVDLNAFPADEETLNKGDKKVEDFPLLKKKKYMDDGLKPHTPAIDLNSLAVNAKPKGKGVLKVRSIETNASSGHRMQSLPSDSWEPCKRAPKGVLKIIPKVDPLSQPEKPVTIPISLGHTSSGILGIHVSEFSPSLSASSRHEDRAGQKLKYLHLTASEDNAKRRLEQAEVLNDRQREEFLNLGVGSFTNSRSFPRKIKTVLNNRLHNASELQEGSFSLKSNQRSRMQSNEAGGVGSCHNGENLWQNPGQQSIVLCSSSSKSDLFAPQNQQKLSPVHHTVPEETVRISIDCAFPQYLEHSEHRHNDHIDGGLSTTADSTVSSGVGRQTILPITYKRKKASTKFKPMESLRQPPMAANIESVVSNNTECNLIGKAKTIKIKVKGWNNHKAQYKQGLLKGPQHDLLPHKQL